MATPIHFMQELLELLLIMLLLVNIDLSFSIKKTFHIHIDYIQLNPDDISCMSVRSSIIIGIWEETQLLTSHYSLNSTVRCFHLCRAPLYCSFSFLFLDRLVIVVSVFFSSFSFCVSFQCCFCLLVCSYEVTTTVCPCTLCNKLLI